MLSANVWVEASDAFAFEGGETGTFRIHRDGDLTNPLTVSLSTDGSATSGLDYTAIASSVVIPANLDFVDVLVSPIPDELVEGDEKVVLMAVASGAAPSPTWVLWEPR